MKIIILILVIFSGCGVVRLNDCAKNQLNGLRFHYEEKKNDYFEFKNDVYYEFSDGNKYAKSQITWVDCNNYYLIVKEASYTDGINLADTLFVKINSFLRDTLFLTASAKGNSFDIKVINLKK